MSNWAFRRTKPAALALEPKPAGPAAPGRPFVVNVPTDLLVLAAWAMIGITASTFLISQISAGGAVRTLLADPVNGPISSLLTAG